MSASEEAKEIIRRWNEEGWSGGKYELAHEIISPNMQVHGAGGQAVGMGPDGLIDLIRTWRTAFPDGRMEIDDLIVEGDTVAIRNTWYGTQTAEFYGIPPSGKSVAVTSVGIDRVQEGLVTEGWGELDMVGMMQQMGALPIVGPGAVAAGADSTWGPTASSYGGATGIAGREPGHPPPLRRGARERGRRRSRRARRRGRVRRPQPRLGHESFDSVLETQATLRAAMPDLALRGRRVEHGLRGRPGRRALGRPGHAHRRGALRRRAVGQGGRLDAQRLRPARAATRSSSAGRPPTCSRCSSRPACSRRWAGRAWR